MPAPRRLLRAVLAIAALAVAGVLAQQAGEGPDGSAARPLILGAATGTGAEELMSPDPEVLRVLRLRAAARAAVDRYALEYVLFDVVSPMEVGGRIDRSKCLSHGYLVQYAVVREQHAAGQCEERSWRASLRKSGRHESWFQRVWDGQRGYTLGCGIGEPQPYPCPVRFGVLRSANQVELEAPNILQLDLPGRWHQRSIGDRLATEPSRYVGQETLAGLVCDKLEFVEPGRNGQVQIPGRSTRWYCPERDYREVRWELVRELGATSTSVGVAVRVHLIQQVDRFLRRGGHWFPAGHRLEGWAVLTDGSLRLLNLTAFMVTELTVGAEVPQFGFGTTLTPPGVMRALGTPPEMTDTRQPYERLEQCLRDGDWLQAQAAATALGAGP